MLSRSDTQKIQSLTIKPLLSQLPGRTCSVFYTLTQVCAAFGVYWVVCSLYRTAALKHNVVDDGLYRLYGSSGILSHVLH